MSTGFRSSVYGIVWNPFTYTWNVYFSQKLCFLKVHFVFFLLFFLWIALLSSVQSLKWACFICTVLYFCFRSALAVYFCGYAYQEVVCYSSSAKLPKIVLDLHILTFWTIDRHASKILISRVETFTCLIQWLLNLYEFTCGPVICLYR